MKLSPKLLRILQGMAFVALFVGLYGFYTYRNASHFPVKPPMGDATQYYQEVHRITASWPFYYKYYLFVPQGYDPKYRYPLVVLLHGVSRHMYGGRYILHPSVRQPHPSFVLVPIAPKNMMGWESATGLVRDSMRQVQKRYTIDPNRLYVSGYSMGGNGSFAMLKAYPNLFAAALILCGAWDPRDAAAFPADVPMLLTYGSLDHPAAGRATIAALQQQRKLAYYREYPGVGHNVWDSVYADPAMWGWLFAHERR